MKFKSIITIVLVIVFSLFVVCCTATSETDVNNGNSNESNGTNSDSGDSEISNNNVENTGNKGSDIFEEPNWSKGETTEIIGKLELGKDNWVVVITNWESRSRVSHYVFGDKNKKLNTLFKNNKGQDVYVKIKGIVSEGTSPWTKKFLLDKIIETYIGTPPDTGDDDDE